MIKPFARSRRRAFGCLHIQAVWIYGRSDKFVVARADLWSFKWICSRSFQFATVQPEFAPTARRMDARRSFRGNLNNLKRTTQRGLPFFTFSKTSAVPCTFSQVPLSQDSGRNRCRILSPLFFYLPISLKKTF